MNQSNKIWLGILAFLPLLISFITLGLVIKNFVGLYKLALADASAETAGYYILKDYTVIMIMTVLLYFLNFLQMIIFIILCVKNVRIENNGKILYIIFLIIFTNITAIIYFFLEIMRKSEE